VRKEQGIGWKSEEEGKEGDRGRKREEEKGKER
jgi:hypothetical protein